jgi:AcrR family transcriptional regulator
MPVPPPRAPRDLPGDPAHSGPREPVAQSTSREAPAGEEGSGTRERLLEAAESLFAEHGYPSTSLRQITGAAGANLAAVHYHFGSKLNLFQEVLHRRLGPINEARIEGLKRAVAQSAGGEPDLDAVLRALLAPALEHSVDARDGHRVGRLIGRSISADGEHWRSVKREFDEVFDHFMPVFARLCPHLEPVDLMWRLHFVAGALGSLLQGERKLLTFSDGLCDPRQTNVVLDQLVTFARAGFQAPAAATSNATRPPCPPPHDS